MCNVCVLNFDDSFNCWPSSIFRSSTILHNHCREPTIMYSVFCLWRFVDQRVIWFAQCMGKYTIIELWHLLYNNGKYFNRQQPQYCLFLKFTNRFTWLTLRMQVADHCIIYLFGESAQKDYRISVVHIPTVHMHVQWTYNTYVQIIKYISSL
jgi:hypothetical protein